MSLRDHTVGEAACLLPATEDLCVQSIHQPNHGGKWCKLPKLLSLSACASREHFVARI